MLQGIEQSFSLDCKNSDSKRKSIQHLDFRSLLLFRMASLAGCVNVERVSQPRDEGFNGDEATITLNTVRDLMNRGQAN